MSVLNETCFNCSAPLVMANIKTRNVRCEYCGMETMLSDQTWRQIQAANAPPPVNPIHMSFQMQENAFRGARKTARGISLMVFVIILASFGFAIYMQHRIQNTVNNALHSPGSPPRPRPSPSGVPEPPRPPTDPDKMVTLTLDSSPPGAKIYLNAREQEGLVTPAKVQTRQSSDILVEKLVLDGYKPYIKKLTPTADLADNAMLVKDAGDAPETTPGKTHRTHH